MGSGQSELGGFRIFKVNPQSPAAEGGLEVFFDFILEVNGAKMTADQKSFFEKIQASENSATKLLVYSIRSQTVRDVYLTPRQWGGVGLLGATVRWDTIDNSENQGIRVLEVFPNSPAAHAGLMPYKDYMLGTSDVMFRDLDELVELVNASLNKKLAMYVYNSDSESIRECYLCPNNNWGGEGIIGCDIGTGMLHRIPAPRRGATAVPPVLPPSTGVQIPGMPPAMPADGVAAQPGAPVVQPGQPMWPPGSAPPGPVPGGYSVQAPTAAPQPMYVAPGVPAPAPGHPPTIPYSPTAFQTQVTQAAEMLGQQPPVGQNLSLPIPGTPVQAGNAQSFIASAQADSPSMNPEDTAVVPPAPPGTPATPMTAGTPAQTFPPGQSTYPPNHPVAMDGPGIIYATNAATTPQQ